MLAKYMSLNKTNLTTSWDTSSTENLAKYTLLWAPCAVKLNIKNALRGLLKDVQLVLINARPHELCSVLSTTYSWRKKKRMQCKLVLLVFHPVEQVFSQSVQKPKRERLGALRHYNNKQFLNTTAMKKITESVKSSLKK